QGEQRRLGADAQAELGEEAGDVRLHRGLGHVEALGDGLVRQALGDERQHLRLAVREGLAQLGAAHLAHEPRLRPRVEAHLAPRRRPHGLEELVRPRLLQHVAGRAGLDDVDDEAVLQHRRQRHDLGVGEAAPDLARGLDAVHHRHQQVHDDDVGPQLLYQRQRLLAVPGLADDLEVGLEPEGEPQASPDHRVVVYEQDADLVHRFSPVKATAATATRASDFRRRRTPTLGPGGRPTSSSTSGSRPRPTLGEKEEATVNVTRDRNSTAALLLIAIGVIALLGTLGVFRFVADLIGALMFGGLAYFAYSEGKRRGNSAWRLASVPLAGLAIAVIAPFGLGGGAFLASLGLAFALYWHEDRH